MPAVKVVDCDGRQKRRRAKLWECFGGLLGINPTNIKDGGNGNYYVIVPQDNIEHIITEESKQKLRDLKFEINIPTEYNAMRTVIVRHIDKVISEYNETGSRSPCMRPRSDPPKMKNSNLVRSRLIILINEEINEANWMVSNSAKLDSRTKQHTQFGVSASNGSRDMARTKSRRKKRKKKN